tara:strand:- start:328 stop:516 length:189 start_codon:yes stop_codon:yes gene_type:complete
MALGLGRREALAAPLLANSVAVLDAKVPAVKIQVVQKSAFPPSNHHASSQTTGLAKLLTHVP